MLKLGALAIGTFRIISEYNLLGVPMHVSHLRKVGGSVMLAVPPALLDALDLRPGSTVGLAVEGNRLIVKPVIRRRYTLDELLAQCDPSAEMTPEDREWLDANRVGDELL